MILSALLADCYARLRYQSAPAAAVTTRLTGFLNETQQELAADNRLSALLRGETAFTTTIGQAEYGLGPSIARITRIRDSSNRYPLSQVSLDWYRAAIPNQSVQSGLPNRYCLLGPKPVTRQPAATGSGIWAVSSSAGDSTQTVSLEAVRLGGYVFQPSATTLTGTSRVQLGSQTDYIEVTNVYLSAVCAGDVTLYDASTSGNVLGVIPKGAYRATDQWIGLLPTPSASLTYNLDYERHVSDLVNATDEPYWLPGRFHRLLGTGARRKEYEYQGDARRSLADQEWGMGLLGLVAYVNAPPDYVCVPGGTRNDRSDLGAWFPAGSIWD